MVLGISSGFIGIALIIIFVYYFTKEKSDNKDEKPKPFFRKITKKEKWFAILAIFLCILFLLFVIFFL